MANFSSTEQRLAVTCERYPAFPRRAGTLARLIKHIYKDLIDEANNFLRPFNVSHAEYDILMMMYGTNGGVLSPSELGGASGEKSANITRLTNQLTDKGLMSRTGSADDRRKVELQLTPAGMALIDSFLPGICSLLARQGSQLSASDQAHLEVLLKKMLQGLVR